MTTRLHVASAKIMDAILGIIDMILRIIDVFRFLGRHFRFSRRDLCRFLVVLSPAGRIVVVVEFVERLEYALGAVFRDMSA